MILTCGSVEEKMFRRQVFRTSVTRETVNTSNLSGKLIQTVFMPLDQHSELQNDRNAKRSLQIFLK